MKATLLSIVLIVTAGVYANSLGGVMQFDDVAILQWLEGGMTSFVATEMGISHRPLPYFTYWLNYKIGGENVIGYHLANLFVHLICVALVFFLVDHLLGGDPISAAFGAAVFGVHPFFSSSVSYIYARGSMMAAMFVFAAALAALKLKGIYRCLLCPILIGLGVLCKEEALIAPALFLGYAVIHGQKTVAKLLLVALVAGLIAVMFLAPHVQTIANTPLETNIRPVPDLILNYGEWPTAGEHLKGVLSGYVFHTLGNLILPIHLTPDPEMVFDRRWIVALVVCVVMAVVAIWSPKKITNYRHDDIEQGEYADGENQKVVWNRVGHGSDYTAFRLALWALLCCPILGALVILVAEPLFEYRAYVLGLGVALMAGTLCRRLQRLRPAPVLAALTLAALAAGTVQRNNAWSNTIALWEDANQKDPYKKRATLNLSAALMKAKRYSDAELVLQKILDKHPGFRAAHVNLSAVYIENRNCNAGDFHARRGVPVPIAYAYIAICQAGSGQLDNALANANVAVKLDPQMVYAQSVRLGIIEEMGKSEEEITRLESLVAAQPDDFMAHATLSVAYRIAGFMDAAKEHSRLAKELQQKGVF